MARDTDGIIQEKFAATGDVGLGDLTITEGWPIAYSTPGGTYPERIQFNQLYRNLFALAVEINQKGPFLDYNSTIDFTIGAVVTGSDSGRYKALIANGPSSSVVDPVGDVSGTWVDDTIIIGNRTFDTVADMIASTQLSVGDYVDTAKYSTQEGSGALYEIVAAATGTDDGGFYIDLSGSGHQAKNVSNFMKVAMWGAIEGSGDSTTEIQAAMDWVMGASGRETFWDGNYTASTIQISGRLGSKINMSGSLTGNASVSTDAVLEIKNCTDLIITGRLVVSAAYNLNYINGIFVWGESGSGGASLIQIYGVSVVGADVGWLFGRTSEIDTLVSEINVSDGYTFGCAMPVVVIGTQTVINFNGYTIQRNQGSWSGPNWASFGTTAIEVRGGKLQISGGEILKAAETTGFLFELFAVNSTSFDDAYGVLICSNVTIECSSSLLGTDDGGVTTPLRGEATFIGCGGAHTQNIANFIETDAKYEGIIRAKGCDFHGTTARTFLTVGSLNNACTIDIDKNSFTGGFLQGLQAYSGGTVLFDSRIILNALSANGQTFLDGVESTIVFTSLNNTKNTSRFATSYNVGSGIFTVPDGGLNDVCVTSNVQVTPATNENKLAVNVAGTNQGNLQAISNPGTNSDGYAVGTYELGDLSAGTTVRINLTSYGAGSTENGGAFSRFLIRASR